MVNPSPLSRRRATRSPYADLSAFEGEISRDFSTFYLRFFKILFPMPDTTIAAGSFGDNP